MKEIFNIKKPLLLFVTLITFTNIGYASFPVHAETIIPIDTLKPDTNKVVKKETTEEYHLRMEKQGFDIESCVCESCRDGKIVLNNNKVLLCRRAIEPRIGLWTVPAGFMENGETVAEAALRETWEEARTEPILDKLYMVTSIPRINQVYKNTLHRLAWKVTVLTQYEEYLTFYE